MSALAGTCILCNSINSTEMTVEEDGFHKKRSNRVQAQLVSTTGTGVWVDYLNLPYDYKSRSKTYLLLRDVMTFCC